MAGWLPAMPTAMAGRWCGAEAVGTVCRFAAGGVARRRLGRFAARADGGAVRSRWSIPTLAALGLRRMRGAELCGVCQACRLFGGSEG